MVKQLKYIGNIIVILIILSLIVIAFRLTPNPPLNQSLNFSTILYDENDQLLRITLANDQQYRTWTPLEKISPHIINSLLLHEDQWFYYHVGFNPVSLIRAFWATYIGGGTRQGASTITMQLARMHWKINTKTIDGKLLQIFRAIELELKYSKHDILEAYLNYAPFGRNIESIGAASLIYFDKTPDRVNLPEALTLTVLPQSPTYRIDKEKGIAGKALVNARQRLFERWQEHYETEENIAVLFDLPLMMRQPEQLPFIAPHFTNQILQQQIQKPNNEQHVIKTTLKIDLQTIIEQQVSAFIERNKINGIYNTSVLLVDNNTMEVKALVGSANYFNRSIQGQVNGTDAKRSPGSTLKPFIYALGMDQSIIHPKTVLKDVATDFGFYTPENFDHHFKGPISVTDALIHSRNIPAVYVAGKLKKPSFYQFLKQAHIREMNTEDHYGLALVLGGGEVTAQELATLYAMLANQGIWQPLRMTRNTDNHTPLSQRLLSPEASFMTLDMLLKNTRNEDILAKKQQSLTPIYWKTGTSWGFRDAWTAGGFNNYTLIVWMGNFDGHSNNAFVGANAAAPLFFNIIDSITAYYPNQKGYQNPIPPNLTQVDICLPSGNLVTQWCKIKGKTWFIPGVSPINIDTVYRPVVIDNKTNKVACPPFNPKDTHVEVYEYWSSDLVKVFAKAGIPKKTPPNSAHCETTQNYIGSPPRITSPLKNVVYKLRLSNKENEKIVLNAIADGEVKKLYWFVDKNFIGSSSVENTLDWVPSKSGIYKISVIDDLGRSDSRKLKVDLID